MTWWTRLTSTVQSTRNVSTFDFFLRLLMFLLTASENSESIDKSVELWKYKVVMISIRSLFFSLNFFFWMFASLTFFNWWTVTIMISSSSRSVENEKTSKTIIVFSISATSDSSNFSWVSFFVKTIAFSDKAQKTVKKIALLAQEFASS